MPRASELSPREKALVRLFEREIEDSGLSQKGLARRARVSSQVVHDFVNAKSIPRVDNLLRIADALDTPLWRYLKVAEEAVSETNC